MKSCLKNNVKLDFEKKIKNKVVFVGFVKIFSNVIAFRSCLNVFAILRELKIKRV